MDVETIRTLYRYSEWANDRLIAAIRELPADQITRDLGGSHRSLRQTLAHIAMGEWIWFERWKGESPAELPDWHDHGDLARLEEALHDVARERQGRLDALTAE